MDAISRYSQLRAPSLRDQIRTEMGIFKKALESQKMEGQSVLGLIEKSVQASRLQAFSDTVRGQNLDLVA